MPEFNVHRPIGSEMANWQRNETSQWLPLILNSVLWNSTIKLLKNYKLLQKRKLTMFSEYKGDFLKWQQHENLGYD